MSVCDEGYGFAAHCVCTERTSYCRALTRRVSMEWLYELKIILQKPGVDLPRAKRVVASPKLARQYQLSIHIRSCQKGFSEKGRQSDGEKHACTCGQGRTKRGNFQREMTVILETAGLVISAVWPWKLNAFVTLDPSYHYEKQMWLWAWWAAAASTYSKSPEGAQRIHTKPEDQSGVHVGNEKKIFPYEWGSHSWQSTVIYSSELSSFHEPNLPKYVKNIFGTNSKGEGRIE